MKCDKIADLAVQLQISKPFLKFKNGEAITVKVIWWSKCIGIVFGCLKRAGNSAGQQSFIYHQNVQKSLIIRGDTTRNNSQANPNVTQWKFPAVESTQKFWTHFPCMLLLQLSFSAFKPFVFQRYFNGYQSVFNYFFFQLTLSIVI